VGLVARWLTNTTSLALPLGFALAAMQVPALTHDYTAALLQVAEDVRRDIDQRETSARHFYQLAGGSDEEIIAALKPFEPSNAEPACGLRARQRGHAAAAAGRRGRGHDGGSQRL